MIVSFLLLLSPVMAQHHHNSYADYSGREIKALSSEEIQGYLSGEGMGMALGKAIIRQERTLDSLFTHQAITTEILDSLVTRIGDLKGQLRAVHLRTHLLMRQALTERQVEQYNQLRGYGESPDY